MSKHHDTFDSIYAFIRCMSRSTHSKPSSGNNGNHWLAITPFKAAKVLFHSESINERTIHWTDNGDKSKMLFFTLANFQSGIHQRQR